MIGRLAVLALLLGEATATIAGEPQSTTLYELPKAVGPTTLAGASGTLSEGDVILSLPVQQGWSAKTTVQRSFSIHGVTRTFRPETSWVGYSLQSRDEVRLDDPALAKLACGLFEEPTKAVRSLNKGAIKFANQASICLADRDRDGSFDVAFLAGVRSATVPLEEKIAPLPFTEVLTTAPELTLDLVYKRETKSGQSSVFWRPRFSDNLRKIIDPKFRLGHFRLGSDRKPVEGRYELDLADGPKELEFGSARIRFSRMGTQDTFEILQDLDRIEADVLALY